MGNSRFTRLLLSYKGILARNGVLLGTSRNIHVSNWTTSLKEKLRENPTNEKSAVSIYRVPTDLQSVEPNAYEPNLVSIGPYHHGLTRLRSMEVLKLNFLHSLLCQDPQSESTLESLIKELNESEQAARNFYSEDLKFDKDELTRIMLVDGCFVIQLLKETVQVNASQRSTSVKRWMLPILRRDLIMLENQLPLFVLSKIFELTSTNTKNSPALQELALEFFDPLLNQDPGTISHGDSMKLESHFLDLIRSKILPKTATRGKEPHMFRSMAELKESGVKIKKADENSRQLELSFKTGILKIPPLYFDDYKFTLFRNMVAFEQCHSACNPDVTTYLFFLDRLINSAKDIELLHYAGVLQHSLGGNKEIARLVNKLCREVGRDVEESYMHNMVWKINCYCNDGLKTKIARLKHDYFYNPWATVSTFAAILLFYLTLLQTTFSFGDAKDHIKSNGFWTSLRDSISVVYAGVRSSIKTEETPEETAEDPVKEYIYIWGISS